MFTFLLVLLIIDSLVLIGAILLQSGKGNGLAASFGGVSSSADSLLGTRQAGNLLTKTSWWGGALFLLLSLVLSIASSRQRAPKSVLDQAFTQPAPVSPAPATSGSTPGTAAGVPLTPAPSAPAATGSQTAPAQSAPAAPATKKP
ncbi:MAG TPA: preprotein translocase subunit SecG [Gemmatimonadaceae bacterium]|jgi:preprotein translocase subunit SecG|nr:preprotein translocase subunit SecG [Gemmatimonadaceae bacterium]